MKSAIDLSHKNKKVHLLKSSYWPIQNPHPTYIQFSTYIKFWLAFVLDWIYIILFQDKNLDTKFKTYKLFLKNLAGSTQMVRGYTYRRVLHYILNITGTVLIFYFYLWEHKSEFNCVFDWHVEARGYKDNIQPAVLWYEKGVIVIFQRKSA